MFIRQMWRMLLNKEQKYNNMFMDICTITSLMSHCVRRKVGCVIVRDFRVIGQGWNGTISNMDNCCEEDIIQYKECTNCSWSSITNRFSSTSSGEPISTCIICNNTRKEPYLHTTKTKESVLHAEQNALMYALRQGISTQGATLYCTDAPCITCAKLIAQAGITKVFYNREYCDKHGLELLASADVMIQQLLKD